MRWAALALCLWLSTIPTITQAQTHWWDKAAPPTIHGKQMPESWWEAAKRGATRHDTTPFRVAAVMWMEMGGWKRGPAGRGRNGRKYIGPCGFNKHCDIPDEIMYDPENQIEWATGLLKGDFKRRLKRYNTQWYKNNYVRDVVNLSQQLEAEARDDLAERCLFR